MTPADSSPDAPAENTTDHRVALVTGASSGIGLATARRLHRDGARVAISARDPDRLRLAAASIGDDVIAVPADVTEEADLDRLMATVARALGPIDVLFVNAGLKRFASLTDVTEELFDEVFATNTKGAYFTVRAALPHLEDGASIVLCGLAPVDPAWRRPGTSVYTASKAALRSFTRTTAAELAHRRIRVNTVNPGAIDVSGPTYLPPDAMVERMRRTADATPMKRLGRPEEIAAVVAFLASDDASYITGQQITVDGGLS
ncbi:SDR family NAD(P)-dependent oxidoreductase [Pseudonocardia cypriaca]|uniref:NAD(P)-dependent dehydrogenase (Short-subunit alcohol dehydrogenase family) n=1 Tax=Pseudonocardia cypriaca TaxID=882449 RepID=A0A543FR55_9PSEU|nr:SDR family oxidoreductase [Pseudonocardia cypriaca]TQM36214.1 NAD(P)-dependent dehydrogenase (short-subunit alcohol dehydrogenase family) [Pseudonocardia cypriaca]